MFRDMRRQDRKIPIEEALKILINSEYGVLATMGANGYPYAVPISFVYDNNCIYFHCAAEGLKLDNINNCNNVSFCVVGSTEVLPEKFSTKYESVVVYGKAMEIQQNEKELALKLIIDKYSMHFQKEGLEYIRRAFDSVKVIKISIENITGKSRI